MQFSSQKKAPAREPFFESTQSFSGQPVASNVDTGSLPDCISGSGIPHKVRELGNRKLFSFNAHDQALGQGVIRGIQDVVSVILDHLRTVLRV